MTEFLIDFEWYKDSKGYDQLESISRRVGYVGIPSGPRIVRRGGELIPHRPLTNDKLYLIFAHINSVKRLLAFVNEYGLLTHEGLYKPGLELGLNFISMSDDRSSYQIVSFDGDGVNQVLKIAGWFRKALLLKDRPKELTSLFKDDLFPSMKFAVSLDPVPKRGYRMRLMPESLLDALRLQLVQVLMGHGQFQECRECKDIFVVGVGNSKRRDSKFCCRAHRIQFNSRKRSHRVAD